MEKQTQVKYLSYLQELSNISFIFVCHKKTKQIPIMKSSAMQKRIYNKNSEPKGSRYNNNKNEKSPNIVTTFLRYSHP